MKKHLLKLSVLMMAFAFTMSSCEKDEEEDPVQTPQTSPPSNVIIIDGSDATLIAVKSKSITQTPLGPIETIIGTGVALFYEDGMGDLLDVGNVSLNDGDLSKQPNNSYVYVPGFSQPTGLDFSNGTNWEVAGNATYNGFSFSPNSTFPDAGEVNSSSTVNKAAGYTLSIASVSGADSVLYQIGGAYKVLPGGATSCEFTPEDLSGIALGSNVAQAAALTYLNSDIDGKNVYFVKESVATISVTVE